MLAANVRGALHEPSRIWLTRELRMGMHACMHSSTWLTRDQAGALTHGCSCPLPSPLVHPPRCLLTNLRFESHGRKVVADDGRHEHAAAMARLRVRATIHSRLRLPTTPHPPRRRLWCSRLSPSRSLLVRYQPWALNPRLGPLLSSPLASLLSSHASPLLSSLLSSAHSSPLSSLLSATHSSALSAPLLLSLTSPGLESRREKPPSARQQRDITVASGLFAVAWQLGRRPLSAPVAP